MQMNARSTRTALAVGAHPDDVEFLCAGTLALLHANGWNTHVATMTGGDCGSATLGREEISALRKKEAAAAAALLNGNYYCLDCDDVFIAYDRPTLMKAIRLIRRVRPEIIFTMSPVDYMVDHEVTSAVMRTACFSAGMRNINTDGIEPYPKVPHLYYMDPMEGKDILGSPVTATTIVDIGTTMEKKELMFLCHESQRSWLAEHHGVEEWLESLRELSRLRGAAVGVQFGEGFRQHRGHAYPQDNLLAEELRGFVHNVHK
jgi:LmbE family N-acetylglucosaminyl deacetylase